MTQMCKNPLLLVIDMQNAYMPVQPWSCQNYDAASANVVKLCKRIDNVIFTKYIASENPSGTWADYNQINKEINENAWLNELSMDTLGHKCYDKSVYSAYSVKEVQEAASLATSIIVTGVVAECCVLSTVMSLIDAGRYVYYVYDAIAGATPETEQASMKVLEGLAYVHLRFITTEEMLALLDSNGISSMELF